MLCWSVHIAWVESVSGMHGWRYVITSSDLSNRLTHSVRLSSLISLGLPVSGNIVRLCRPLDNLCYVYVNWVNKAWIS